ncbi:hypothetical protein ACH5RR_027343 [Cinchona calisaya]|uniref:Transcription repressor n=1 Tax=Cinchona calisaya TaxID=153742 RepID=A0ABD2Z581_9GENT
MTKRFNLHISSFQFCRSNNSSTLAKSPSPATRAFTPVNPKAFDITHPKSPAPPPSTPIGSEAIEPQPFTAYISSSSCNVESPGYRHNSTLQKLYNSPEYSEEFDQSVWPFATLNAETNNKEENHWLKDQSAASFTMSISSADSGCFNSEDCDYPNDESEGLLSSCSSLESSCDFGHPMESPSTRKGTYANVTKRTKKDGRVRRLESDSCAKKTVLQRLLPCVEDGKVKESYAIMKKSADPFNEFKMSMLEMILEKQISEPEDLEKLLMCFLSLNSKEHHAVIVAAFTEVWEDLFSCNSKPPNSSG